LHKERCKNECAINGNEYLSDLDCLELDLEVVEDIKEGYKSYVVQSDYKSKNYTVYSSSDD